jgi:thiol-disulfide isomerase/thioredoxin
LNFRRHLAPALVSVSVLFLIAAPSVAQSDAETRVLNYIRDHLQPGQPLVVTDLYNKVFTQPDERKVLDKLYNAFFRIPLFVAQYQERFGSPPTLRIIAGQFDLHDAAEAAVLLRVMESDPRVPRFLTRDPKGGEITHVDIEKIMADERFASALHRQLGGWEGKPAPEFQLTRFDSGEIVAHALQGEVTLLYIWFTGCPPCLKEMPELVTLYREFSGKGFEIIGANADHLLGLDYDDAVRSRYLREHGVQFPLVYWTRESDKAYGGISIYPTLFLISRKGLVTRHWIGYVQPDELRHAISITLEEK